MAAPCGGDPLVCIDWLVVFIGEFLKDWTTLAMLAILLVLLFRLRSDQTRAKEDEYARHLAEFDQKRDAGMKSAAGKE